MVVNPYFNFVHKLDVLEQLRGMYIVFEGRDGSGKTTLIDKFSNIDFVKRFKEPSFSALGRRVQGIIKDFPLDKTQELMLFNFARYDLINKEIIPARKNNHVVFCDRFHWSSYVYQEVKKDITRLKMYKQAVDLLHGGDGKVDVVVYCDTDNSNAENRLRKRGVLDKFERDQETGKFDVNYGYYELINSYMEEGKLVCIQTKCNSYNGQFIDYKTMMENQDYYFAIFYDKIKEQYLIILNTNLSVERCFENLYEAFKVIIEDKETNRIPTQVAQKIADCLSLVGL